jgi:hypothetical protein
MCGNLVNKLFDQNNKLLSGDTVALQTYLFGTYFIGIHSDQCKAFHPLKSIVRGTYVEARWRGWL